MTTQQEHPLHQVIFNRDNLEVLRGINTDSVDLIYLDPPFNNIQHWQSPLGAAHGDFKDTWSKEDIDFFTYDELRLKYPNILKILSAAQVSGGNPTMNYLLMMSNRLTEMRRILKPSGSIYLHCDDTESHSLKLMMDAIFGRTTFKNEIIWKRTGGRSHAKKYGRVHDTILYYAGENATWNTQWMEHDPDYIKRAYRHTDERGRWQADQLTAGSKKVGAGLSHAPWRGITPANKRNWNTPIKGGMSDFLKDHIPGWPDAYPTVHDRLDALDEHGFIYWPNQDQLTDEWTESNGMPRLKRYLASSKGRAVEDIFSDIGKIEANSKENVFYPTQKPLPLLERIISASSNPGDVILDPFAGCNTACIAAEKLGRQWIGIDISPLAINLMKSRMKKELGHKSPKVKGRSDIPRRTDLGRLKRYNHPNNKEALFGTQRGICNGCGRGGEHSFGYDDLEVDHIVPSSKGGTDHLDNLQLLCGRCNRKKKDGSMSDLMKALLDEGMIDYD